jgi:actin-related protein 8
MLVIPDFYDRVYVREFINLLLVSLGFKQICVQQASRGIRSGHVILTNPS